MARPASTNIAPSLKLLIARLVPSMFYFMFFVFLFKYRNTFLCILLKNLFFNNYGCNLGSIHCCIILCNISITLHAVPSSLVLSLTVSAGHPHQRTVKQLDNDSSRVTVTRKLRFREDRGHTHQILRCNTSRSKN